MQLNLGIARFWAGEDGAKEAWQSAAVARAGHGYAVTAGNLLHPEFARNLPVFVPTAEVPACRSEAPGTGPDRAAASGGPADGSARTGSSTASRCSDSASSGRLSGSTARRREGA